MDYFHSYIKKTEVNNLLCNEFSNIYPIMHAKLSMGRYATVHKASYKNYLKKL